MKRQSITLNSYPRYHVNCGGELDFTETKHVVVVINKRDVDRNNAKAKIKQFDKDFYKCEKCKREVNIVVLPSLKDYEDNGEL